MGCMNRIIFIFVVLALLALAGCSTKISDIKSNTDDYLGREISVPGTAVKSIKIGKLSGFTLKQDDESIPVASSKLPDEGEKVTVKGTVNRGILGTYLDAFEVR